MSRPATKTLRAAPSTRSRVSLRYFTEGPDREPQLQERDDSGFMSLPAGPQKLHRERPDLHGDSGTSIRSIPDSLVKGPDMRAPCDSYDTIWIGADGSVRLCWVILPSGTPRQHSI